MLKRRVTKEHLKTLKENAFKFGAFEQGFIKGLKAGRALSIYYGLYKTLCRRSGIKIPYE